MREAKLKRSGEFNTSRLEDLAGRGCLPGGATLEVTHGRAGLVAHCRAPAVHARRCTRRFSRQSMLHIALSKAKAAKVLSGIYKCSHQTVRRVQCAVAQVYLQSQVYLYGRILKELAESPPDFVCTNVMWDETGERLKLARLDQLSGEQRRTVCDVMVTKMSFAWGWAAHGLDWHTYHFAVVCPPSQVLTPAAEHLRVHERPMPRAHHVVSQGLHPMLAGVVRGQRV